MAFGTGAFLSIWGVVPKGKYYEVEVSSSRKNQTTGIYETDFSSKFVKFCGAAATKNPQVGQRIKVTSCCVQNCYEKDKQRYYLKNPIYTVFDYELQSNGAATNVSTPTPANNPYIQPSAPQSPLESGFEPLDMRDEDGLPF